MAFVRFEYCKAFFVHLPTHLHTMASIANVRAFQVLASLNNSFTHTPSTKPALSSGCGNCQNYDVFTPSVEDHLRLTSRPREEECNGTTSAKEPHVNTLFLYLCLSFLGCSRLLHCLQRQGSDTEQHTAGANIQTFTEMTSLCTWNRGL